MTAHAARYWREVLGSTSTTDTTISSNTVEVLDLTKLTDVLISSRCRALGEQYRDLPLCKAEEELLNRGDSFILLLGYRFIASAAKEQLDLLRFKQQRQIEDWMMDRHILYPMVSGLQLLLNGHDQWKSAVVEAGDRRDYPRDRFLDFLKEADDRAGPERTTLWTFAFSLGFNPKSVRHISSGIADLDSAATAIADHLGIEPDWAHVPDRLCRCATTSTISILPEAVYERVLPKIWPSAS